VSNWGRRAAALKARLAVYEEAHGDLPGVVEGSKRNVLVLQLSDSLRRVEYVNLMRERGPSPKRANPNDLMFDPLLAAIVQHQQGNDEEAAWLTFLYVHFGKHASAGYQTVRDVYGRLGDGAHWDWNATSQDPVRFRDWLHDHQAVIWAHDHPHGFGNHRKYESIDARSPHGTGAAVQSYVTWVRQYGTHRELFQRAIAEANRNPREAFNLLYQSMRSVIRFGRLSRFEYLATIGKLRVASIEAGSAYLSGATGPLAGARLLFGDTSATPIELDERLIRLDGVLGVGMQALEDALCNWQKSPGEYKRFRG
jgi:hypothetical protein